MKCANYEVKTPLGQVYVFRFFYNQECSLSDMENVARKIAESPKIRVATNKEKQYFVYNQQVFYLPLGLLGKRRLVQEIKAAGKNETPENVLAHAQIRTEPTYETK